MGREKSRHALIALGFAILLGIVVYFIIWTIDYRVSSGDTELMRRQFDLASREAMEESAEWRGRYDMEVEKATKCSKELKEFKKSLGNPEGITTLLQKKLESLQKENLDLLEQVELLKREIETEKLNCGVVKI